MFGFNDNAIRAGLVSAHKDAELTQRVGGRIHRLTFDWRLAERRRDEYDFREYDDIYSAMLARGIRPLVILLFSPEWTWDRSVACSEGFQACRFPPSPEHYAEWREIAALLARRYPESAGIEIWNEPNLRTFWAPRPDPRRYTELLREAYRAIKASNPSMPVVSGGFGGTEVTGDGDISLAEFTRAVYENGGKDSMDALAFHPYPDSLEIAPLLEKVAAVRSVRTAFGDQEKPLWVTEVGLSTTGVDPRYRFTESEQAEGLVRILRVLSRMADVDAILIHTLIEPDGSSFDRETGYGVVHTDLHPKPAYCALGRELGSPGACPTP